MRWCFTCDSKPITDGLGLEHEKHSGCVGSEHDIGIMLRVGDTVLYEDAIEHVIKDSYCVNKKCDKYFEPTGTCFGLVQVWPDTRTENHDDNT